MKAEIIVFFIIILNSSYLSAYDDFKLITKPVEVGLYDFAEFELKGKVKSIQNAFTDISLKGYFTGESGVTDSLEGFCDAQDGSIYRLRYMVSDTGTYKYELLIICPDDNYSLAGTFKAVSSDRKGPLRIDRDYPWHFILEGTNEHFFWNATTTYWLMGWKNEEYIFDAIDRLASLNINRIRVAINGRQDDGSRWFEPLVKESEEFTFRLNPWMAENPESLDNPNFDVTRFNISYWQKLDRLVSHAREKNIIVSLVFYVDGREHGCDPFKKEKMGGIDEQRYYRYAVARYSGFSNIMWDITNEYHLFRSEKWVDKMGKLIKTYDPVKHLISVHGHSDFAFRKSEWVDVALYQSWDECGGYQFITDCRKRQIETGRIIPQVNEEYGYEEHYPTWGCGPTATKEPDGRSALNRSKLAWEIYMAGGYQTTGERANEGTGAGNDQGGGWINGRGNDSMIMFKYYTIIKNVFEQTEYWKMLPRNELTNYGNLCLANENEEYIVYSRLPNCRLVLPKGNIFIIKMINPLTYEEIILPETNTENGAWQYPKTLYEDRVFIIKRKIKD